MCSAHLQHARKTTPREKRNSVGRLQSRTWSEASASCEVAELNHDARTYHRYALRSLQARVNGLASLLERDAPSLASLLDGIIAALADAALAALATIFEQEVRVLLPDGFAAAPTGDTLLWMLRGCVHVAPERAAVPFARTLRALAADDALCWSGRAQIEVLLAPVPNAIQFYWDRWVPRLQPLAASALASVPGATPSTAPAPAASTADATPAPKPTAASTPAPPARGRSSSSSARPRPPPVFDTPATPKQSADDGRAGAGTRTLAP